MKAAFTILVTALLGAGVRPATHSVEAPVRRVTVFPTSAGVARAVELDLSAGSHSVLFENLSANIDPTTFRTSAQGVAGAMLLGFDHWSEKHLEIPHEKVAELERRLETLEQDTKQAILDRIEGFEAQEALLDAIVSQANKDMTCDLKHGGVQIDQWKAVYQFVGEHFRDVNDSLRLAKAELVDVEKVCDNLEDELRGLKDRRSTTTRTVQVDLSLQESGSIQVELEYVIPGAFWAPLYDVRIEASNDSVEVVYYAEVSQTTGEDWTDVEMVLSTARPATGIDPGPVVSWVLSASGPTFMQDAIGTDDRIVVRARQDVIRRFEVSNQQTIIKESVDSVDLRPVAQLLASVGITDLAVTFEIPRKVSITSGDRAVRAAISSFKSAGKTTYVCRSRNRQGVYRTATLTNSFDGPLLPGKMSVFAGSDFLGHVKLPEIVVPGESFELPFGQLDEIEVKREVVAKNRGVRHDKEFIEQTIQIVLINNGTRPRSFQLEEPLPVSQQDNVEVDLGRITPEAEISELKDRATWQLALEPGQEEVITIPIRIEYPKAWQLRGM